MKIQPASFTWIIMSMCIISNEIQQESRESTKGLNIASILKLHIIYLTLKNKKIKKLAKTCQAFSVTLDQG